MPKPSEPRKYSNIEGKEVRKRSVEPIKIKSASDSLKPTVSNPTTSSKSMRKAKNKKVIDSTSMVLQWKSDFEEWQALRSYITKQCL
jgi:hypothetical protein